MNRNVTHDAPSGSQAPRLVLENKARRWCGRQISLTPQLAWTLKGAREHCVLRSCLRIYEPRFRLGHDWWDAAAAMAMSVAPSSLTHIGRRWTRPSLSVRGSALRCFCSGLKRRISRDASGADCVRRSRAARGRNTSGTLFRKAGLFVSCVCVCVCVCECLCVCVCQHDTRSLVLSLSLSLSLSLVFSLSHIHTHTHLVARRTCLLCYCAQVLETQEDHPCQSNLFNTTTPASLAHVFTLRFFCHSRGVLNRTQFMSQPCSVLSPADIDASPFAAKKLQTASYAFTKSAN